MKLPTSAYMFLGLFLGFILVAALIVPAIYGQHDSTSTGTGDNTGGDNTGGDNGGGDNIITVPTYDPNNYYKATGTVRITTDANGNVIADFIQVSVVRYTPAPIKLPDFPALRWTQADYRVYVQFIDIHGKIVEEKTVWDDLIPYGSFRTVSFEVDMGHWTGGTLRVVVERMDGSWFVGDTENVVYRGEDM